MQTYVARLRRAIAPGPGTGEQRIMSRRPGYLIRVDRDELDVARFEALALEGRRALSAQHWSLTAETLRRALSLWRGPALGEFAHEPFARAEAVRLEEGRVGVLEDRIAADLALGSHAELIGELEALVVEQPLREKLRGQLMVALYRSGRQGLPPPLARRARPRAER